MTLKEWLEEFFFMRDSNYPISTSSVLFHARGKFSWNLSERLLRKTIKEIPRIVSTSEGYYIAKSKEEVERSLRPKNKMAISLLVHNKKTKEAYPEFYDMGEQLKLELDFEKGEVEWK